MGPTGEGQTNILGEAEKVSHQAQVDHFRRDATRSILGIPENQLIDDAELEQKWNQHLEKIHDLRSKWNIPEGEDPIDHLLNRLQKKLGQ